MGSSVTIKATRRPARCNCSAMLTAAPAPSEWPTRTMELTRGLGSEGFPKCMIGYRCCYIALAELIRELIKAWRKDVGQTTQQINFSMHTGTRRSRGCRPCANNEKNDGQAMDRET